MTTKQAAASENSGNSPVYDRIKFARAVILDDASSAFTTMVGEKLMESNLAMVEANMKSMLRHKIGDEPEHRPDLTQWERQRYVALQNVVKSGMWDSRSSLASRLRLINTPTSR